MKKLSELLSATTVGELLGDSETAIHGLTYDSRAVGAGDCFTGSLAGGLKICKNLERAIEFATAAASLKISKMGAQSVATLEEVKKLAAQYPSR